MDEKKLDAMLKGIADELPGDGMDEKELERQINRRLKAIAARTVLMVLAMLLGLLLIVNPIVSLCTYNPMKMQKRIVEDGEEGTTNGLEQYARAYASVFLPYRAVYGTEVRSKGFGGYEVTLMVPEPTGTVIFGSPELEVVYEVWWGRWRQKKNTGRFQLAINRFDMLKDTEEVVPELSLLPESSLIYCTLLLEEAVEPETLSREGVHVHWLRVEYNGEVDAGISLDRYVGVQKERGQMTGSELKEEFLTDLDILLSDTELLGVWGVYGSNREGPGGRIYSSSQQMARDLREMRDSVAAQDTIHTRIVNVSGHKQDVLDYVEAIGATEMMVDYVKLSQWSE